MTPTPITSTAKTHDFAHPPLLAQMSSLGLKL